MFWQYERRRVHLDNNRRAVDDSTNAELATVVDNGFVPLLFIVELRVVELCVLKPGLRLAYFLEIGRQAALGPDDCTDHHDLVVFAMREREQLLMLAIELVCQHGEALAIEFIYHHTE